MPTKKYYCTEDNEKLIKYKDVYICEKCKGVFRLIDNSKTVIVDDIKLTLGTKELIKIN